MPTNRAILQTIVQVRVPGVFRAEKCALQDRLIPLKIRDLMTLIFDLEIELLTYILFFVAILLQRCPLCPEA